MYQGFKIALIVPVLDEELKIGEVVRRAPREIVDEVLVVDDGSKDRSREVARAGGATVLAMGATIGVGAALRAGFLWARRRRFDLIVVCAGNNKDAPEEIPRLLDPIVDGADFVQGSRFLSGGRTGGMPLYRQVATRLHPLLFSLTSGGSPSRPTASARSAARCSTIRASASTRAGSTPTSSSPICTGRRSASATARPRCRSPRSIRPRRSATPR
jgi:dolichol-phosphate mannosyltransferase